MQRRARPVPHADQGRRDRPKAPSATEARRVFTAFVHDDPLEPTSSLGRRIVAAALSRGAIAGWLGVVYGAEAPVRDRFYRAALAHTAPPHQALLASLRAGDPRALG